MYCHCYNYIERSQGTPGMFQMVNRTAHNSSRSSLLILPTTVLTASLDFLTRASTFPNQNSARDKTLPQPNGVCSPFSINHSVCDPSLR